MNGRKFEEFSQVRRSTPGGLNASHPVFYKR